MQKEWQNLDITTLSPSDTTAPNHGQWLLKLAGKGWRDIL